VIDKLEFLMALARERHFGPRRRRIK